MKLYIKKEDKYIPIIHEKDLVDTPKARKALQRKRQRRQKKGEVYDIIRVVGGVYFEEL